jgi:cbb3-type cytochrome oxidase subunit 3
VTPPETSGGSFLGGFWFVFSDEGRHIAAWCSAFTGLERVHLDGVLVSEKRALRGGSSHEFDVAGHHYRVSFEARLRNFAVYCRLEKDGVPASALLARQARRRFLRAWHLVVMVIVISESADWLAGTFHLSQGAVYAGAAILSLGSFVYLFADSKIVIELG